jgi:hypothetical protein
VAGTEIWAMLPGPQCVRPMLPGPQRVRPMLARSAENVPFYQAQWVRPMLRGAQWVDLLPAEGAGIVTVGSTENQLG